jgi:hypothetical protein
MDGHKVAGRVPVRSENGNPESAILPWRIIGVGDFDRNGNADILWHNESDNALQIWLMDGHKVAGRVPVRSENGNPESAILPWRIIGSGMFNFRGTAEQKIRELYLRSGAHRGLLGFPLSDVQYDTHKAEQRFAGGFIQLLDTMPNPKGVATTCVRVRFVGFHCDKESVSDQLSGSDEPYFIIGVAGSNHSNTVRFGPYEDIDSGTVRFESAMLADPFGTSPIVITPPIVIGVVAIEHDSGSPEEAETNVRNIFKAIEEKFEQAVATFGAASPGSHVLPEWARDIVIGWVPEGIAAVFGLGDDKIGAVPLVMFDFNPGLDKWETPPQIGHHGPNPYNTEIVVDGGDEGKYTLRFNVEIAIIDIHVGPGQ